MNDNMITVQVSKNYAIRVGANKAGSPATLAEWAEQRAAEVLAEGNTHGVSAAVWRRWTTPSAIMARELRMEREWNRDDRDGGGKGEPLATRLEAILPPLG